MNIHNALIILNLDKKYTINNINTLCNVELKKVYHVLALNYHPDKNSNINAKEDFQNIELSLKKKDYFELVRSLIVYHYDKAYKKTRAENHSNIFKEIELKKINLTNIKKVIALNNFR